MVHCEYRVLTPLSFHSGTVALCAGCNAMASWAAVVVGAISGPLFIFGQFLLRKLKVAIQ